MTTRRTDGQTDSLILVATVLLSICPSARLPAQLSFHLAAGVRYSSTLVHDSIVSPVDLRPALAPAFLVTVQGPLRPGWSADATIDVSPSGLRRHETGGSFDAGSFTAIAFTVGLRRELAPGVAARLGVGGLSYSADQTGVFREGSGGLFPVGTVAATYTPPSPLGARRRVEVEARYDLHRFITPALRTEGFVDPRTVHRAAVLIRIGWSRGGGPS